MKRNDRLVILGDPGSGKTTLLRYLALSYAQALWDGSVQMSSDLGIIRFPVLLRIAEYAEGDTWRKKSLSEFLADAHILHECPNNGLADLLHTELTKGECLILLDGLDEIVNADNRRGIVQRIEDFVRHHAKKANRFVITSRIAGYRSAPLGETFTHYTVQEMDKAQIQRFLERWCQAVEDGQTPEISLQERRNVAQREIQGIMKAVDTSPGVQRLAANPLLLRTLALIHRTGARLPQKRIELYKLATDTLARTWRTARGVPESALVKEEYLTPLLSTLAYWLHVHKPTGIATEREVYEVLGEEWARINDQHWNADEPPPKIKDEVKKFLLAVREHTGLFVERAPKRYGFMHLTFEEYYAARYLVARSKSRAKLIRHHLHDPRWEEPILLALGFLGLEYPAEARELIETAILAEGQEAKELHFKASKYESLLGRDFLFALRCFGDAIPFRASLSKRLIDRFANELLHHTGPAHYERYQQMLRERLPYIDSYSESFSHLRPILLTALQDKEAGVRGSAAFALGLLDQSSPEVINGLLSALQDEEAGVRNNAASTLGRLGQSSPEVINALLSALQDKEAGVRGSAAFALGLLDQSSPEVINRLLSALQDEEAEVRDNVTLALQILDQSSSSEVINALFSALQHEETGMRLNAAITLEQLGQSSPEVISTLLSALQNEEAEVRDAAAAALEGLDKPSPEVINALLSTLQNEKAAVSFSVTFTLGQLGQSSPEVINALLSVLRHKKAEVSFSAAFALQLSGQSSPEVINGLLSALQDEEAGVRGSAASSLGQSGQSSPEVITALLTALHDEDADVRRNAAFALGQSGQSSPEVILALLTALRDENADVRRNAAFALGQSGQPSPEVVEELSHALRASSSIQRRDAMQLLSKIAQEDRKVVDVFYHGLLDEDNNVRATCAKGLAFMGKRFPTLGKELEQKLRRALQQVHFQKVDNSERAAYDYAYDALWYLIVGDGEAGE